MALLICATNWHCTWVRHKCLPFLFNFCRHATEGLWMLFQRMGERKNVENSTSDSCYLIHGLHAANVLFLSTMLSLFWFCLKKKKKERKTGKNGKWHARLKNIFWNLCAIKWSWLNRHANGVHKCLILFWGIFFLLMVFFFLQYNRRGKKRETN